MSARTPLGHGQPDNFTDGEWAQRRDLQVMAASDRAQLTGSDAELLAREPLWQGLTARQIRLRKAMTRADAADPGAPGEDVPGSVML